MVLVKGSMEQLSITARNSLFRLANDGVERSGLSVGGCAGIPIVIDGDAAS